jgi:pimeloyl-ACP methyl ester carboxylesterase
MMALRQSSKFAQISNATRIEYQLVGDINAHKLAPIVLLNGSICNFQQWRRFVASPGMRSLASTRGIILYNYSGYGRSSTASTEPFAWCIDTLADELSKLLEFLTIPSAHLFGVSKGTGVIQAFARRHPERIASMAGYGWIQLHHDSANRVSTKLKRRVSQIEELSFATSDKPLDRKTFSALWHSLYREIITGSAKPRQGLAGRTLDAVIKRKAYQLIAPMSVYRMTEWFNYAAYLYSNPPVEQSVANQSLLCAPLKIYHGAGDKLLPSMAVEELGRQLAPGTVSILPDAFTHVSPLFNRSQGSLISEDYQEFIENLLK